MIIEANETKHEYKMSAESLVIKYRLEALRKAIRESKLVFLKNDQEDMID